MLSARRGGGKGKWEDKAEAPHIFRGGMQRYPEGSDVRLRPERSVGNSRKNGDQSASERTACRQKLRGQKDDIFC